MPIATKCNSQADVVYGLATVCQGARAPAYYDPNPSGGMGVASKHFASGDALGEFVTLDKRYKVGVASGVWK